MMLTLSMAFAAGLAQADHAQEAEPIDRAAWLSPDRYPAAARQAGEQGRVGLDVDVDREGRPTACRVTGKSGSTILDTATCALVMEHGQFTPARDAAGRNIAGR